jgi:hypothetical protein
MPDQGVLSDSIAYPPPRRVGPGPERSSWSALGACPKELCLVWRNEPTVRRFLTSGLFLAAFVGMAAWAVPLLDLRARSGSGRIMGLNLWDPGRWVVLMIREHQYARDDKAVAQ